MIDQTFEVLVLFDEQDRQDVATLTARHFTGFQPALHERYAHPYYEMKNAGLAIARGELIVLWDSDIETVRGGLRTIIDAFREFDIPLYEWLDLLFLPFAVIRSQMPRWAR